VHRSKYLVVYTDLPAEQAKQAICDMERTLTYAARYWGQDPRGQIECYLIQKVEGLIDAELPHPLARILIDGVGGVTLPARTRIGNRIRNTPTILASTRPGVAEHELVHAYCTQTFGSTGPGWYSEGMAELVVQRSTRNSGVRCSADQIRILRDSHQICLSEVLSSGNSSKRIMESLNAKLANRKNPYRPVPITDWEQQDIDNIAAARQDYLRSWALCYLLLHNPNYGPRFKLLGRKFVTRAEADFSSVFAPMHREIAFEYSFFLKNIGVGYRVDLCSWDWSTRFQCAGSGDTESVKVGAALGYQPSGLSVREGRMYRYTAEGPGPRPRSGPPSERTVAPMRRAGWSAS
jgi:hypothetical protein